MAQLLGFAVGSPSEDARDVGGAEALFEARDAGDDLLGDGGGVVDGFEFAQADVAGVAPFGVE